MQDACIEAEKHPKAACHSNEISWSTLKVSPLCTHAPGEPGSKLLLALGLILLTLIRREGGLGFQELNDLFTDKQSKIHTLHFYIQCYVMAAYFIPTVTHFLFLNHTV